MVVDMEEGTLSFIVDGTWLGVAHSGLKGQKVIIINSKTGPDTETGFTNPEYISTKLSLLGIANTIERSFKNFSSIDLAILKKTRCERQIIYFHWSFSYMIEILYLIILFSNIHFNYQVHLSAVWGQGQGGDVEIEVWDFQVRNYKNSEFHISYL